MEEREVSVPPPLPQATWKGAGPQAHGLRKEGRGEWGRGLLIFPDTLLSGFVFP